MCLTICNSPCEANLPSPLLSRKRRRRASANTYFARNEVTVKVNVLLHLSFTWFSFVFVACSVSIALASDAAAAVDENTWWTSCASKAQRHSMKSLYLNSISLAYEMLDPLFISRRRVLGHSVDFSHSNVYSALLPRELQLPFFERVASLEYWWNTPATLSSKKWEDKEHWETG